MLLVRPDLLSPSSTYDPRVLPKEMMSLVVEYLTVVHQELACMPGRHVSLFIFVYESRVEFPVVVVIMLYPYGISMFLGRVGILMVLRIRGLICFKKDF